MHAVLWEASMALIELTDSQRQTLEAQQGKPVDVVDPATQQRYVLLDREQYEHMRTLLGYTPATADETSGRLEPMMLRSQQAFWQDLPELLKRRSKQRPWVAYHGDERVGFGKTRTELYQDCLRRGLPRGAFY